ncbi:hypothetical protein CPE1_0873 [Chlamydia pecorum PV3056/3]|uniref:CT620/CT621 family type III secretion system effector n=1 Tax=Chlamydia pecorum TaxID=85991 RepID=UPI0003ADBE89|nr:CT620/CT621 family type III secretion system effector [Chlamydia pecorum]AGW38342.1 hypothetical protein CPE1_0873 [Chlamydia pecorum PV3056/3]
MAIQNYYIHFTRNVTSALSGGQLDAQDLASAVFLFQELDQKVWTLKRTLGWIEDIEPRYFAQVEEPVHVYEASQEASPVQKLPESKIELPELSYTDTELQEVINKPDLASAKVFIQGLEAALEAWLTPYAEGGIADPTAAENEIVTRYQNQLATLKTAFNGTPTDANYTALYALPASFIQEIEELEAPNAPPKSQIAVFWQDMMVVYSSMAAVAYPAADYLNTEISKLYLNISAAQRVQELLRQFASVLKDFLLPRWDDASQPIAHGTEYNSRQAAMIQSYLTLGGVFRMLTENLPQGLDTSYPDELRNAILSFFTGLRGTEIRTSGTSGSTTPALGLGEFLGIQYVYQKCASLYGEESTAQTEASYKAAIRQEKTYWDARGNDGFKVTGSFDAFANNLQYPNTTSSAISLSIFQDNTVSNFNPRFFQLVLDLIADKSTLMTRTSYQTIADAANAAITAIDGLIGTWNQQILAKQTQRSSLDPSQLKYFESMNANKETFVTTSPLQSVYTSLMLDKFLPAQQQVIRSLGDQMTFSNKTARYLNQIIQMITSFHNADTYYSLSIYLKQMNLQSLTDAVGKAKSVLANEITRCGTDITRCKQAKIEIDKIIPVVKADTEMSSSQIRELVGVLTSYKSQFDDLIRHLSELYVLLKGMEITAVDNPDETIQAFTVSVHNQPENSWVKQLATFESFVIEGGQNGVVPGGEKQLLQSLESSEQDYTTFNQNQQLALQLEMSAMQQEWTIVSTALALLNQMFAKIARRIKS